MPDEDKNIEMKKISTDSAKNEDKKEDKSSLAEIEALIESLQEEQKNGASLTNKQLLDAINKILKENSLEQIKLNDEITNILFMLLNLQKQMQNQQDKPVEVSVSNSDEPVSDDYFKQIQDDLAEFAKDNDWEKDSWKAEKTDKGVTITFPNEEAAASFFKSRAAKYPDQKHFIFDENDELLAYAEKGKLYQANGELVGDKLPSKGIPRAEFDFDNCCKIDTDKSASKAP